MTQPARIRGWGVWLFLVGVAGVLVACDSPGGDGCGGIEDQVSCVTVTGIEPTATAGGPSSNVDAFQGVCDGGTFEPFTDHSATITFSNTPAQSASSSLPVTILRALITYSLRNCPSSATCPPLPEVTQDVTLQIETEGTGSATFPFVPLAVKDAYGAQGGSESPPPSYTANYRFTARTQGFADTFTIQASQGFTIGNFDLCP